MTDQSINNLYANNCLSDCDLTCVPILKIIFKLFISGTFASVSTHRDNSTFRSSLSTIRTPAKSSYRRPMSVRFRLSNEIVQIESNGDVINTTQGAAV